MKTLVTLLAAGALALSTGALAAKPTAAKAIKEAKAAVAKTDAVGFLWRDTNDLLKQAEEAASKGDKKTALDLAQAAQLQAKEGYLQYKASKEAGPRF